MAGICLQSVLLDTPSIFIGIELPMTVALFTIGLWPCTGGGNPVGEEAMLFMISEGVLLPESACIDEVELARKFGWPLVVGLYDSCFVRGEGAP